MELFLSSIYTAFFCFLILRLPFFKIKGIPSYVFVAVFLLKLIAALALTLIYTYYYKDRSTADIFKYFDDAKILFAALKHKPFDYFRMVTGIGAGSPDLKHYYLDCNYWYKKFDYMMYNDNRTIIRFNAIVLLFSFGKFFVHNVFISFLSIIGLMGIYKVFVQYYESKKMELLVAIFLLPSVLLWTSGTLKEGLVVFAFGLFFYCLWNMLYKRYRSIDLIVCLSMIFVLLLAKYYVIACAIPGILFLLGKRMFMIKNNIIAVAISLVVCFLFLTLGRFIGGSLDVINTLTYKHNDFVTFSLSLDNVGSLMDTSMLKPNLIDFSKHIPDALYKSLFKPFPWDVHNVMSLLPAAENVLLVVLCLLCIFRFNRQKQQVELLLFSISFVLCLNILNGLIVPVYGALVRYKVPAMPFLFAVLLCLIDVGWKKSTVTSNDK
jgi:hypothetical protein